MTRFNSLDDSEQHIASSSNTISYSTINGHTSDFVKQEISKSSTYTNASCQNIEQTPARVSQQFNGPDFAKSTFPNHNQVSDTLRASDETVKQESISEEKTGSAVLLTPNGFLNPSRTRTDENFRLMTDGDGSNALSTRGNDDDLENQLSYFERVLQGIKSRDESSNEADVTSNDRMANMLGSTLVNSSLSEIPEKKGNQLTVDNNPLVQTTSSQQYGISRSTAQALQQRLANKVRYERSVPLNTNVEQNILASTAATNSPRLSYPPTRLHVLQQLQRRSSLHISRKIPGTTTQALQARNPAMTSLGNYSMQSNNVRFSGVATNPQQNISALSHASGRIPQNLLMRQALQQGQMPSLPRHQMNMVAQRVVQQQKLPFAQQITNGLPSYSHAQQLSRSSAIDQRQKFSGGISSTQVNQLQSSRALSHLQHFNPPHYGNHSALQNRPVRFPREYSSYAYQFNQENKLHSSFQRASSIDDSMMKGRFHGLDINRRNTFTFQRSSSVPNHAHNSVFNQSSLVRHDQSNSNLSDMNNNGSEHMTNQDMTRAHAAQASLNHLKRQFAAQSNNIHTINAEPLYQANNGMIQNHKPQVPNNLQTPLSNSFSNMLDMKSTQDNSLFPILGQELTSGPAESSDIDSLLKTQPSEFDLLNLLDEPQKAL